MTSHPSSSEPIVQTGGPYVGDPETRVVHLAATEHYRGAHGQMFWELRPAREQGYNLCPECYGYARSVTVGQQPLLERTR
jgi:hypothetical protein